VGDDDAVHAVGPGVVGDPGLLGGDDRLVGEGPAATPVLLRDADAQQASAPRRPPEVAVDHALLCPPALVGHDLLVHEGARELLEVVELLGQPRRPVSVQDHLVLVHLPHERAYTVV
jgi:hypothetical protein